MQAGPAAETAVRQRAWLRPLRLKRLRPAVAVAGFGLALTILAIPAPEGLSVEGQRALAAFATAITLWVTNLLPAPATGLLAMALVPLLGALPPDRAFAFFGNRAVFFILGALMLAAGLQTTGLGDRLALAFLRLFDANPRRLLAGILLTSALLACIMPEHAVAALMFPLVLEIARGLRLSPGKSRYGKALFLSMAWGTVAGGVTTFLGGARNLLAVGLLEQGYGMTIGFLEWVSYSWPVPAGLLAVGYAVLVRLYRPEIQEVSQATQRLEGHVREMGRLSSVEWRMAGVTAGTLGLWILGSQQVDLAVTALMAAGSMFALRIVSWKDMEEYVSWGVILMYGGALVVATALAETGVVAWASERYLGGWQVPPMVFVAVVAMATMGLSEMVSNVAAVATILPLAYGWGAGLGVHPAVITLVTALAGGLAFMFPMGTPPNAIAYSSGFYSISDAIRGGALLSLAALVIFLGVAAVYWPLVGLR